MKSAEMDTSSYFHSLNNDCFLLIAEMMKNIERLRLAQTCQKFRNLLFSKSSPTLDTRHEIQTAVLIVRSSDITMTLMDSENRQLRRIGFEFDPTASAKTGANRYFVGARILKTTIRDLPLESTSVTAEPPNYFPIKYHVTDPEKQAGVYSLRESLPISSHRDLAHFFGEMQRYIAVTTFKIDFLFYNAVTASFLSDTLAGLWPASHQFIDQYRNLADIDFLEIFRPFVTHWDTEMTYTFFSQIRAGSPKGVQSLAEALETIEQSLRSIITDTDNDVVVRMNTENRSFGEEIRIVVHKDIDQKKVVVSC